MVMTDVKPGQLWVNDAGWTVLVLRPDRELHGTHEVICVHARNKLDACLIGEVLTVPLLDPTDLWEMSEGAPR